MDSRRKGGSEDHPIYSRLFVICGKHCDESLKDQFAEYGRIDDFYLPTDHNTGDPKGIAYIKYSKTSEAARAMEALNMKLLPNMTRPIKVMVAQNRSGIHNDDDDMDKYKRLFIHVQKSANEEEIMDYFKQFGGVETVTVQRDRDSGESKGFAYVKYRSFYEAAKAFEECDKKYKPLFAQPKGSNRRHETSFESNIKSLSSRVPLKNSLIPMMDVRPEGYTRVLVNCSPFLTQFHIASLFDIIPGMTDCRYAVDLYRDFGKGLITYSSPVAAAYAVQKLNQFEYPPGHRMFVKPDFGNRSDGNSLGPKIPDMLNNLKSAMTTATSSTTPDIVQLAEAIAEASKFIKVATAGLTDEDIPDKNDLNYCSVQLPPPQPLADIDAKVAKRCFLVCKPQPPPLKALRDIFCRFGDLINVYTLPNKTVGYARYATVEAADQAIKTLHGAEICGVRIKVLEAEEDTGYKKRRYDDDADDDMM